MESEGINWSRYGGMVLFGGALFGAVVLCSNLRESRDVQFSLEGIGGFDVNRDGIGDKVEISGEETLVYFGRGNGGYVIQQLKNTGKEQRGRADNLARVKLDQCKKD